MKITRQPDPVSFHPYDVVIRIETQDDENTLTWAMDKLKRGTVVRYENLARDVQAAMFSK